MDEQHRQDEQPDSSKSISEQSSSTAPLPIKVVEDNQNEDADSHTQDIEPEIDPTPPSSSWWFIHLQKIRHVGLHEWLMLAATIVMAVSTVAYTHYAAEQWSTLNDTLSEIKQQTPKIAESADAAKDTTLLNRQTSESTSAAIIEASCMMSTEIGGVYNISCVLSNEGKTIAVDTVGDFTFDIQTYPAHVTVKSYSSIFRVGSLRSGGPPHLGMFRVSLASQGLIRRP